ncbi:zinc finger protein castor homolog 1-like isoform X2 [Acanthaster planci]|uniref:Zinc finger protein castor homolog 1-like isoform X2 n=1 Tax=Acanthaster planci TaxID=133434 RepID=A0A8B7YAK1_ACAPL|nr:zinc finger protein castor homolog 1-like isoform X2 [Acanthaster planci]
MLHPSDEITMKKLTLKLDAICAKLKEGLAGPLADGAPINGVSLECRGVPVTEHYSSSSPRKEILNGSESGVSPCLSANELDSESVNSQDEGNEENGFLDTDTPMKTGLLNGHVDTTKVLSGASKRKARLKLAPRRFLDSTDSHLPHENGYSDSPLVDRTYPRGAGSSKTINGGCSNKSQGSNTSDSTSMQISLSRRDLDLDYQGNNYFHRSAADGTLSDPSSPGGEQGQDATPLWYADDSPSENSDYLDIYPEEDGDDEDSLGELDTAPNPANLSNLKAIQEYAERSLTEDQTGQPIEEGLATNDVICELAEEGGAEEAEPSSVMQEEMERPSLDTMSKNTNDNDEDKDDEDYAVPTDSRPIPLKIPVIGKRDKHGNPYDPSAVQEYASDTMNELIGMYGFEEGSNPDIAKDVPLDSFSFKNIQKMEEKNASERKKDALQKYIHRHANLHVPDLTRFHGARSSTSPEDTGSQLPLSTCDSSDIPNQGSLLGSDATPQLASQAGVGGKVASLPQASEPQSKMRLAPPLGKTTKTVKDLINEQKGREEGAELEEGDEDFRPRRFSKYDFFIQSLEAGQAIDYSAHRISKYDSYIRKLKAGEAIHKVIGRRQSASQKIRDIISTQIHRKHEQGSDGAPGDEEEDNEIVSEKTAEAFNPIVNNHIKTSKYASKYDYFLNKLRKGDDVNPFEITLSNAASTSGSETTSNSGPSPSTSSHGALLDYTGQAGDQGNLVITEEPEQRELSFAEGTGKRNISNGLAKMVKDEITPGEMNVFSKYISRYSGSAHCGHLHCVYQYKEHYHCNDEGCNFARFTRKEDVVRHYNWHKRRDNSLQHGFMRFSPSDNCSPYYPDCTINLKHTHYHCLQSGCNKVYTSTSDVLTHENFHKKNMSLINEGFQRFRATEDCGVPTCTFYGHKTTHFHCRRPGCDFVFKNKCDIEKHKTYHIKDDIYRKDGFKKFSKHEKCKYNWCKYSNNTNHFHCIRKNCGFVFTAANQMQSHKRKHDRRQRILEYEAARHQRGFSLRLIRPKPTPSMSALKRLRDVPETVLIQADGSVLPQRVKPLDYLSSPSMVASTSQSALTPITVAGNPTTTTTAETDKLPSAFVSISSGGMAEEEGLSDSLNLPVASHISPPQIDPGMGRESVTSSSPAPPAAAAAACIALATAASQSNAAPGRAASNTFSSSGTKEGKPEEPWQKYLKRYHMLSDEASDLGFQYFQQGESCEELFPGCSFSPLAHYHCMWSLKPGIYCGEVVHTGSSLMKPHYEKHKMNPELESIHISAVSFSEAQAQSTLKAPTTLAPASKSTATHTQSCDANEVPGSVPVTDLLPSTSSPGVASGEGFITCEPDVCTVEDCPHRAKHHYHCTRGDCQFATENQDMLRDHKVNESVIFQSFRQMSRKMDCRRPGCKYNLLNKHYHCLHQGCNFSFLQIQQMESHGRKHMRRIYGKHFNKPGGSLIGPQQLVIPMVSASSVPFSSAVSNQIMFSSAAPILTLPSLTPSVVPSMSSTNAAIMNAGSLGLMSVGNMGVVNQVGVPIQMINPTVPTSSSKPLPPFMIPLSPLDDEDVNGNQAQPSTSQNYDDLVQLKYQSLALKNPEAAYAGMVPTSRKRSLNLIEEDPGAPSGYKRYKRGPLDSMMMDRFRRFDRSESCGEDACQFNMTTTHYHCLHEDCTYRFAGKTMMYKHAQHHDRVNSIIQNDFRRFKANHECEQDSCPYQGNSTHFHCLRCTFVCTDSGKVAVHRKQHAKTDTISAAGFKQYSSAEPCGFMGCKYTLRYSHFHCNRDGCTQGVIGMTQMETHRRRHMLNVRV